MGFFVLSKTIYSIPDIPVKECNAKCMKICKTIRDTVSVIWDKNCQMNLASLAMIDTGNNMEKFIF